MSNEIIELKQQISQLLKENNQLLKTNEKLREVMKVGSGCCGMCEESTFIFILANNSTIEKIEICPICDYVRIYWQGVYLGVD